MSPEVSADRAQRFADALQRYEQDGDVDRFVTEMFADDAELLRPEQEQALRGQDGAREFWQQYRAQFQEVRSDFDRVSEGGDLGVLEWRSDGQRAGGGPISYRGVSLLDFDGEGRVRRFATYFDTAAFVPGVPASAS